MINVSISKIVERYKVTFDRGPSDMYIEVYEKADGFYAECNYSLWTKKQNAPYFHGHSDRDIKCAVEIVLSTLKPEEDMDLEDFCWVKVLNRSVAVLGTGDIIDANNFK